MATLSIWAKAMRLPFLSATILPILLGATLAFWAQGSISYNILFHALLGAIFFHLGTNLANDYYDHTSGNDEGNKNYTKFNGGSRVIQNKELSPKSVLLASILLFALGILMGLLIYLHTRYSLILWIGGIGAFIGFFYTASPIRLGYRGVGEILTGIGFGPLLILGAYASLTGEISTFAILLSVPMGILVALILFINEFPDYDADKKVGKKTLVVIVGKKISSRIYLGLLCFCYAFIGVLALKMARPYLLLPLLTLPLALKSSKVVWDDHEKIKELLPACAMTIGLHISFGILLIIGLVLDIYF